MFSGNHVYLPTPGSAPAVTPFLIHHHFLSMVATNVPCWICTNLFVLNRDRYPKSFYACKMYLKVVYVRFDISAGFGLSLGLPNKKVG